MMTVQRSVSVAAGVFAPGHLGELTQIVPFEMVDAVLSRTRRAPSRVRALPPRVVVYLLLAAGLFEGLGYRQVWARLVAGLDHRGPPPSSSALAQARARVGVAPLKALFELLAGPPAGAVRWRGLLLCAIDGTSMFVPDSPANLAHYGRQSGSHGGSGYPMLRLVAVVTVVACGTRTVIDAVFGPYATGELAYAPALLRCLRPGMLLLADRNFAVADLIGKLSVTGSDLLIRCKNGRRLPRIAALPDGSFVAMLGSTRVRVIDAQITATLNGGGRRTGRYRLVTTLTDHHRYPAAELVKLYHQRWEIETTYLEIKSTTLSGRVLRARTPAGIDQEVYALLTAYQTLRTAIADATLGTGLPADRASFTTALQTARDQVVHAAGIIADTTIDLPGRIGRAVLADPMPARRARISPRVVKRAISKHRAKGTIDRTNHQATITINVLIEPELTAAPGP
ncbi:IS4 family transposase [Spirillospora sp. NPDC048911]|uniref:IS4 family transposase n=1 Tax=Spirillospora sp. NPDC048911 TaxID=3364527 RepID=UPI00370F8A28